MAAAPLIFCERTGSWAVACRRALAGQHRVEESWGGVRIVETRSIAECREVLASGRAGFAALELTETNCRGVLDLLLSLQRGFPAVKAAVLADRTMRYYEWLTRELGAVHFETSPRCLLPLVRVACRHLQQLPPSAESTAQQIWAGLPWGEV